MPNYDLGVAHGKVQVTADSRGVTQATASIDQFKKALDSVTTRAAAFNAAMDKVEAELNQVARDFRKASDAAHDYERAIRSASSAHVRMSRSAHALSRDFSDLDGNVTTLTNSLRRMTNVGVAAFKAFQFADNIKKNIDGVNSLRTGLNLLGRVARGGVASSLGMVASRILGINKAMSNLTPHQATFLKLAGTIGTVSGAVLTLSRSGGILEKQFPRISRVFSRANLNADDFSRSLARVHNAFSNISRITSGAITGFTGFKVAQAGIKGLISRFDIINNLGPKMKFTLGAAFKIFPGLIQAAGKSLVWFSNTLVGTASAAKQLAGGLLALPGLWATIGAAAVPLMGIIATLKTNMKDLIDAFNKNDPEKFQQALAQMPPYMRNFAKEIVTLIPKIKDLGNILTEAFIGGGLEQKISALANGAFPVLAKGGQQVALSWRNMAVQLMNFLGQSQTLSDFDTLFSNTSQILNTVANALKPVLSGLRDIGIVGSTFIRDLALSTMPKLSQSFADWASKNRQSGQLLKWMRDGALAVRQLTTGMLDLGRGLWSILTMFQTGNEHGLSRFVELMNQFKNAMQKSSESGNLKKWGDAIRNLGTDKLHQVIDMFKDLGKFAGPLFEFLMKISDTIRAIFGPALAVASVALKEWLEILNSVGVPQIIGVIYGISGAFKVLKTVIGMGILGPLRNIMQIFGGAGMMGFGAKLSGIFKLDAISQGLAGISSIAAGVAGKLSTSFGAIGSVLGKGVVGPLGKVSSGLSKMFGLLSAAAGPIGLAVAALAGIGTAIFTANSDLKAFNAQLDENKTHLAQFRQSLEKAFVQSGGIKDKNVLSGVSDAINQTMSDLQATADKAPGIMDHIGSAFIDTNIDGNWKRLAASRVFNPGNWFTGTESAGVNKWQEQADQAKHAQEQIQKLQDAGVNVGDKISGSKAAFDAWIDTLRQTGAVGEDTVNVLNKIKSSYDQIAAGAEAAGPAALQLAQGIQQMANAGNDAQTKLEGLKTALQGLGLMQQSSFEAAAAYEKGIQELGDTAAQAAGGITNFNDVIDKSTGFINPASEAGRALYDALNPVAQQFLTLATKGGNVAQMWQEMQPQLDGVAQAFHLTTAQVQELVQKMGVVPDTVDILVKLSDKDATAQHLAAIIAAMQSNVGNGVVVPVHIGDEQTARDLSNQVNAMVGNLNATHTDQKGNILLSPGINAAEINAILAQVSKQYNIPIGPNTGANPGRQAPIPTPAAPAPAPVAPEQGAPPEAPAPKGGKGGPKPPKPPKNWPAGLPLPSTIGTGGDGGAAAAPAAVAPSIQQQLGQRPAPAPQAPAPTPAPAATAPAQIPPVDLKINGADQFNAALGKVKSAIDDITKKLDGFKGAVEKAFAGALTAVNNFATQAISKLNGLASTAKTAGIAFSNGFADGIKDQAALANIAAAATAAAKEAADRMPHSPARKGPLSGRGWSGFSGLAFATDFASGITRGVSNISSSANEAAAAAKLVFAGLNRGVPDQSSAFMNQFKQLLQFVGKAYQTFTGLEGQGAKFLQYISDPTGKGTSFFGRPLGFQRDKNVSDADLADRALTGAGAPALLYGRGAAGLGGNLSPSRENIIAAIAGEAQNRGYDRNTAIAVISAAMHESSLNPNITNASGHHGLFQQSSDKPLRANANEQITWMFNQLDALGGQKALAQNPLDVIATQVEKGGYTGTALAQHAPQAAKMYDSFIQGLYAAGGVAGIQAPAGAGYSSNPASVASNLPQASNIEEAIRAAGGLPRLYSNNQLPAWMTQMAKDFGLTASTYDTGGSLHQMGFAGDFSGTPEQMRSFASYISQNLAGQTLQLIYSDATGKYGIAGGQRVGPGTNQPNYYSADWAGHGDHVHWATDVAPLVGGQDIQSQSLANLRMSNAALDQAIGIGRSPNATDQQVADSLSVIQGQIDAMGKGDTPESKAQIQALDSVKNEIVQNRGMAQKSNPISGFQNALAGVGSVVNDVISSINAGMDAIGGAKDITDVLVRGVANTKDVMRLIDDTQKFITFAASIAQTVGDTAGMIGQFIGAGAGADPTGGASAAAAAVQGVSVIADVISGVLQGVNAAIDLAQEAWNIFGSYFGDFLGFLTGGANSLRGDVQFLLDQNTGQLMAYSTDNPMQKTGHYIPGQVYNPDATKQGIGQINVYGGPGSDPRDNTREMLYQVKAAGFTKATAQ